MRHVIFALDVSCFQHVFSMSNDIDRRWKKKKKQIVKSIRLNKKISGNKQKKVLKWPIVLDQTDFFLESLVSCFLSNVFCFKWKLLNKKITKQKIYLENPMSTVRSAHHLFDLNPILKILVNSYVQKWYVCSWNCEILVQIIDVSFLFWIFWYFYVDGALPWQFI